MEKIKRKIRWLGWQKISYLQLNHLVHYLNVNFIKPNENDSLSLPNDSLLHEQRRNELNTYSNYRNQEFVIEIKEPTIIEPLMGGVIAKLNLVVEDCYALPMNQYVPIPHFIHAMYKISQSNTQFKRAILLRHPWGDNNYFHFYNDILPKLGLLSELNTFNDLPIIVSKKLYDSSYFQSAIKLAQLEDRTWIIQNKEYIKVDNLITIRAHELTKQGILRNLNVLNFTADFPRNDKKILLVRPENSQRNLTNREELIKICLELGFEIIDCSRLSLEEQINVFANARYIVGEHGAAFSNIIYRCYNPLDVVEIFPPSHISTCYFVISQDLQFNHHVLRCSIGDKQSYELELDSFKKLIKQVLFNSSEK